MPCASARKLAERHRRLVAAARGGAAVLDVDLALPARRARARRARRSACARCSPAMQRGGAGIDRLPAGECADALRDRRGVAGGHHDVFDAAADMVGHDLRQRRARALSLDGGAGRDRDLAVGQHAHGDALERPEARAFDVIADADAEIAALGARVGSAARGSSS